MSIAHQCDRCGDFYSISDDKRSSLKDISSVSSLDRDRNKLSHYDLCLSCAKDFKNFMQNQNVYSNSKTRCSNE